MPFRYSQTVRRICSLFWNVRTFNKSNFTINSIFIDYRNLPVSKRLPPLIWRIPTETIRLTSASSYSSCSLPPRSLSLTSGIPFVPFVMELILFIFGHISSLRNGPFRCHMFHIRCDIFPSQWNLSVTMHFLHNGARH